MSRELILDLHTLCGVAVFVSGFLQIVLRKGGALHRGLGRAYVLLWLVLLLTGAYLGGPLISLVGIFGFYFALTGARVGALRGRPFAIFDRGVVVLATLAALVMVGRALSFYLAGQLSWAIIFLVFGLLFLATTVADAGQYLLGKYWLGRRPTGPRGWFFDHLTRMGISFIAAVTAFTSIQNLFGENTLNFLAPTAIGVGLIALAKRRYRRKFGLE